ncbi:MULTISPECIES: hypothetical protein [Sphingobacterium]|uniref:hypothetical protein n=1 Tax=Sphingobacterium TaxID=28453 RepID=UPI0025802AAB|nr:MULTISPECIES: hypothetical protein [Sphingobacterium]
MQQDEGKYTITNYQLDSISSKGGRFVMDSETDMELKKVSNSVFCLQFKWSRRILRTDNNNVIVSLGSLSHIEFASPINDELINNLYRILKEHEERNLEFIKMNSFDIFNDFQNVYYSSFLDENLIPMDERKNNMVKWLETKVQELDINN